MPAEVIEYIKNLAWGILFLLGILGILFLLVWIQSASRKDKLRAIAHSLGANFRPKETPAEIEARSAQSQLGSNGYVVSLTNIFEIAAAADLRIKLFDYFYSLPTGTAVVEGKQVKKREAFSQTALLVQSRLLNLPEFVLRPASLHEIGEASSLQDINFPEAAEFGRMFTVRGRDEAAVRGVFTPAVIEFCQARPGIVFEGYGERLLFYRSGEEVKPSAIQTLLEEGKQVAAAFVEALRPAAS
jgi:hypothetical protein